ncbi:MAG: HAD family hydrolase [Deltaproteobacteria bacterium]|nr:HAD family hydrolase [Deltaproteobacteria bacterium]
MKKSDINQYLRPLKPLPTSLAARGELRERIECILFDVYGTLFISGSGDISVSQKNSPANDRIKQLLKKYSIRRSPEDILDKLHGSIKARHGALRSKGVDHPEVIIDQIWQQVLDFEDQNLIKQFAIEFELISNPVSPMPNLKTMLSACRKQKILMGIISNAQFYTPLLFDWFFNSNMQDLGFDPDLLFYSFQHQVAKPSPALFDMAADNLAARGIEPAAVLYIGNDMLNDIYPAHSIGFQTALFAGDQRSLRLRTDDPRCANLKPDLVLTDLLQLISHVQ